MIDRLRQMAIFAKAIDHGAFRGAAKELGLSPSVVSHHISQLEEHLGVALIYRSTRKLTLTREGERLLSATRTMLEAAQEALHELSAGADVPSGKLRITVPSVLSKSPFTDMIANFLEAYPRVELSLDFSDERKELIDGGFDIAIRMGLNVKKSPTTRALFHVERRLIASHSFLALHDAPEEPTELSDWNWLALTPTRDESMTFRKDGIEQIVQKQISSFSCNDAQALYNMALAGAGIAIVPEFLTAKDNRDGKIAYVLPDWALDRINVFAQWPSNAPKKGLIKLLVNELSQSGKNSSDSINDHFNRDR